MVRVLVHNRPKGRPQRWRCVVEREGREVFSSDWVSVALETEDAARCLGEVVNSLDEVGAFIPPPGHSAGGAQSRIEWKGDLNDDCEGELEGLHLHVEHLDGPKRCGHWFIGIDGAASCSEALTDIRARSAVAARWLAEVIATAVLARVLPVERKSELARSQEGKTAMGFLEYAQQEGVMKGKAGSLLRVLDRRHLALTPEQREHIQRCTDEAQLDAWLDRAIEARSADEVFGPVKH